MPITRSNRKKVVAFSEPQKKQSPSAKASTCIGIEQTQDFVGWEEDEGTDLRQFLPFPCASQAQTDLQTQPPAESDAEDSAALVEKHSDIDKEVDGIFSILNGGESKEEVADFSSSVSTQKRENCALDSNKSATQLIAGRRHRQRRRHTRSKILNLSESLRSTKEAPTPYGDNISRKKRRRLGGDRESGRKKNGMGSLSQTSMGSFFSQTVPDSNNSVDDDDHFSTILKDIVNCSHDDPGEKSPCVQMADVDIREKTMEPEKTTGQNGSIFVEKQQTNTPPAISITAKFMKTPTNQNLKNTIEKKTHLEKVTDKIGFLPDVTAKKQPINNPPAANAAKSQEKPSYLSPQPLSSNQRTRNPPKTRITAAQETSYSTNHNLNNTREKKTHPEKVTNQISSLPHVAAEKNPANNPSVVRAAKALNLHSSTNQQAPKPPVINTTKAQQTPSSTNQNSYNNPIMDDDLFGDDSIFFNVEALAIMDRSINAAACKRSQESDSSPLETPCSSKNHPQNLHQNRVRPETTSSASSSISPITSSNVPLMYVPTPIKSIFQGSVPAKQEPVIYTTTNKTEKSSINKQTIEIKDEDPFGDFPMIDFDELDRMVATRSSLGGTCTPFNPQDRCNQNAGNPPVSHFPFNPTPPNPLLPVVNPIVIINGGDPNGIEYFTSSRYKVHKVIEDIAIYTKTLIVSIYPTTKEEKIFITPDETKSSSPQQCIHLMGEWYHTIISPGDTINVVSVSGRWRTDFSALPLVLHTNPPPKSTEDDLLLVLHPDMLLTPTTISDTVSCSRMAVVRQRMGSSGMTSKAAIVGTMRHDLFEFCMQNNDFSIPTAMRHTRKIVRNHAESLVGCNMYNEDDAVQTVVKIMPQLQQFAHTYTSFHGMTPPNSHVDGSILKSHAYKKDIWLCAKSIFATEESVVSPELGLKGNIDATILTESRGVTVNHSNLTRGVCRTGSELTSLMAVELKTGHNQKPHESHMAQLALYTFMLRMRHGSAVIDPMGHQGIEGNNGSANGGMLLYLNHESRRELHVSPTIGEIKSLIGQRNLLAAELRQSLKPRGVIKHESESNGEGKENTRKRYTILPPTPAKLPNTIFSPHQCNNCYSNKECMMYLQSEISLPPDSTNGVTGRYDKSHGHLLQHFTSHLTDADVSYFKDWDRMIDLEAAACENSIVKSWLVSSVERETSTGKCISSLKFDTSFLESRCLSWKQEGNDSSITVKFHRCTEATLRTSLSNLKIEVGNHVVISSDNSILGGKRNRPQKDSSRPQMHILRGFVEKMDDHTICLRTSRGNADSLLKLSRSSTNNLRFRLDKYEISSGTGTLRQNLVKLFTLDVPMYSAAKNKNLRDECKENKPLQRRMAWLRGAVVHLSHPPRFDVSDSIFSPRAEEQKFIGGCDLMDLAMEHTQFNPDQRAAVTKIIYAQDYTMVQGMPGTGKSSTIAFVVRLLAARGKRILLTSYTHAAVDNLVAKLFESGVAKESSQDTNMVRIGSKASCHSQVHRILVSDVAAKKEALKKTNGETINSPSAKSLRDVVSAANIVAVTALTIPRSPLLAGQHFDVVIVDEAGQISQPAILGALMAADSFVLVGDHLQLPPLVVSPSAEQAGYGVSMMTRLADAFPDSVAQLTFQYRMHGDICALSNYIAYKGALKCANEEVQTRTLRLEYYPERIPSPQHTKNAGTCSSTGQPGWLGNVLDPNRHVVFVDTDTIVHTSIDVHKPNLNTEPVYEGLESQRGKKIEGGSIVNETEKLLVRNIIHGMLSCGLQAKDIGVISPYRAQLRLLDEDDFFIRAKELGLEISTIDRFQGRDKPVIVLSLVRSNTKGKSGRLLDDFRRLNVAFSRAKCKLIIVGSFRTLHQGSEVLRPILDTIKRRGWIQCLPHNGDRIYESQLILDHTSISCKHGKGDVEEKSSNMDTNVCLPSEKVHFCLAGSKRVLNVSTQEIRNAEKAMGN